MKEAFFTPARIRATARMLLDEVRELRVRHSNIRLDTGRMALLVLDLQDYFLTEDSHAYIPAAPAIIPGVQMLIEAFKMLGRPIVFTRHVNTSADAGMMSVWWNDLIQPESPLSQISASLDTIGCHVIEKHQYDAFHGTDLESYLLGVEQVVITGVMTHLCCETTARAAFMHGFRVLFAVDGTATYSIDFHRASLRNLSHGFAVPMLVDEILEAMGS